MPSKNSIKTYVEGGFYHLYNRGVEKRQIFMDDQDYQVFISLLKLYLIKPNLEGLNYKPHKDLSDKIDLVCYCLMPNHFHLLVHQSIATGIEELMRSINIKYAMYFNKRHQRIGGLFQGAYKAVLIKNDEYLTHLSRYIHQNPLGIGASLVYPYSSYKYFLSEPPQWLKPKPVLELFGDMNSYRSFVESNIDISDDQFSSLLLE